MTLVSANHDEDGFGAAGGARPGVAVASGTLVRTGGRPGGVIAPAAGDCLPRRALAPSEHAAVWWLGAHGGAGESTLQEMFRGSRAAAHAWPLAPAGQPPARVVLVARTHAHGLVAAQLAIRDWAAGEAAAGLLGLVLIADAPGRLPHALRQLASLIAGAAPAVWTVPWVEAWRVGDPPGPSNAPKVVSRLLCDLQALTGAPATHNHDRKDPQ